MRLRTILTLSVLSTLLLSSGCSKSSGPQLKGEVFADCPSNPAAISGTGATFPEPLYQVWIAQYQSACPNQQITYKGTGSGRGVEATKGMTTTFGASDGGLSEKDLQTDPNLVMFPVTGGGIAVAYNLPQAPDLKLSRNVLVEIFSGSITRWNDEKIKKDNPHYTMPDLPITVVVRGDSSGSTETFSRYLAVNPMWNQTYGVKKEIAFPPQAIRADGGSALANKLTENFGSIGYLEFGKAKTNGLSTAAIENREGAFVLPSIDSIQAALGSISLNTHLGGHDGNPTGKNAYPIVNYTWLLFNKQTIQASPEKTEAFKSFVKFTLTPFAQDTGIPLEYVPLNVGVKERVYEAINTLN